MKKNRLKNAEIKYSSKIQELLTNPINEILPDNIINPQINSAFSEFLEEILKDENECAEFISKGNIVDEIYILRPVFEHFKSNKIYEAIKSNCEIAFSHKYSIESKEIEQMRKDLLLYISSQLKQ